MYNNSLSELFKPYFFGKVFNEFSQKAVKGTSVFGVSKSYKPEPFALEITSEKISALLYLICVCNSEINTQNLS